MSGPAYPGSTNYPGEDFHFDIHHRAASRSMLCALTNEITVLLIGGSAAKLVDKANAWSPTGAHRQIKDYAFIALRGGLSPSRREGDTANSAIMLRTHLLP